MSIVSSIFNSLLSFRVFSTHRRLRKKGACEKPPQDPPPDFAIYSTMDSPRQRFLNYVRRIPGARPVVSPFLPKPELVDKTLHHLGLPVARDPVQNEIRLA